VDTSLIQGVDTSLPLFNTGDGYSPQLVKYKGWIFSSPCSILGMDILLTLFNTGGGYSPPLVKYKGWILSSRYSPPLVQY